MLGLDNFNDYYPVALKRARQARLAGAGVYTADGDLNDRSLLARLFALCEFTHVLHLAAQVRLQPHIHDHAHRMVLPLPYQSVPRNSDPCG